MLHLDDLATYTDATRLTGLNYWKLKRLIAKGEIEAVPLPGNKTAIVISSLKEYKNANRITKTLSI